ncbi:hypothetical protein F5146DRAFT_1132309 [Armillaria mellea]|nr:hypothetical protein F5146DRAFT_1132309 [Armillaria mellea]
MAAERNQKDQEREINLLLRRAKESTEKGSPPRKAALQKLIDLAHSSSAHFKILAAQNIKFFFADFPELEEDAINAVYDICEDQSSKVRTEGYIAITGLSAADNDWVKRNTDVLLQLLQSEEPEEVAVIKTALREHLVMAPSVTLGEIAIRDRLRGLVLAFMTNEAKETINQNPKLNNQFVEGLTLAIPRLADDEAASFIREHILPLSMFSSRSPQGDLLLQVMIRQLEASDLKRSPLSPTTRSYLSLAHHLTVDKKISSPLGLLKFYYGSLTSKITLMRLSQDDQTLVLCQLAEILAACEEDLKTARLPEREQLQKQVYAVVDVSPIFFERLASSVDSKERSRKACELLLNSCIQRKAQQGTHWTVPTSINSAVQALSAKTSNQALQLLIRSLAPTEVPTPTATTGPSNVTNIPASLPPRPAARASVDVSRKMRISGRDADHVMKDVSPQANPSKRHSPREDPPRYQKRAKTGNGPGLSLLNRLADSASHSPREQIEQSARRTPQQRPPDNRMEVDGPPEGGYSIKGAAKMESANVVGTGRQQQRPPPSLIDRLESERNNISGVGDTFGSRGKQKRW